MKTLKIECIAEISNGIQPMIGILNSILDTHTHTHIFIANSVRPLFFDFNPIFFFGSDNTSTYFWLLLHCDVCMYVQVIGLLQYCCCCRSAVFFRCSCFRVASLHFRLKNVFGLYSNCQSLLIILLCVCVSFFSFPSVALRCLSIWPMIKTHFMHLFCLLHFDLLTL